jgi:uncharacterized protein with PhoU and TrkA domain
MPVANIKQNFLEMKDLSELMVDLAYSALFLQDRTVAAEVEQLYERIQQLDETTRLLFRIKETDEKRIFILDLVDQVKHLSNAARHIAQLSQKQVPGIVKEAVGQTDERVIVLDVSSRSSLCGKAIAASHVGTKTGARIIAVKRRGSWMFTVEDSTVIQAGDQLVAKGTDGAEKRLGDWASGKQGY